MHLHLLLIVSAFLNISILVIWTYLVYTYALVTADTSTPKIAVTLWAYGVTVGPIQFLASKESAENINVVHSNDTGGRFGLK